MKLPGMISPAEAVPKPAPKPARSIDLIPKASIYHTAALSVMRTML